MRIISQFRDYYDHVSPGDATPKWMRKKDHQRIILPDDAAQGPLFDLLKQMPPAHQWHYDCMPVVLAFCGRAYRGYYSDWYGMLWRAAELERVLVETWKEERDQRGPSFQLKRFLQKSAPIFSERPVVPDAVHRTHRTPVVMLYCEDLHRLQRIKNPCLQNWKFDEVIDAETAWQELDMYLSNQLAPQPPAPAPLSQALIRDAHGFDAQSFRSDAPSTKKSRRKANRKRKRRK